MSATPARRDAAPLAELADAIQSEHDAATTAARTAIGHAIRCGELLTEVKAQVPHGGWAGWLAEHFAGSARTASGYMRLAAHADELANRQALADLGIEGALKRLAAPPAERSLLEDVQAALPDIDGEEWEAFKRSIDENGVLVPIVQDEHGRIIDGRQRVRAAEELGVDYRVDTIPGLDDTAKAGMCFSLNVVRGVCSGDRMTAHFEHRLRVAHDDPAALQALIGELDALAPVAARVHLKAVRQHGELLDAGGAGS